MTAIEIQDNDLTPLNSKVIVLTGGASGIGLASASLFLSLGAKVVVGDITSCPLSSPSLTFLNVDVRDWNSQSALFKRAIEVHGRIDHVFANAGISGVHTFVEDEFDDNGELLPPDTRNLDINLMGMIYTCKLGIHYLKKQKDGGSVVITASPSGFLPFSLTDYCVSKHGVMGLMRGLTANLAETSIRVNCVAPLWTATGLVPKMEVESLGVTTQAPEVVAKSVALCMADESRRGQTIYSIRGKYKEVEKSLLGTAVGILDTEPQDSPADEKMNKEMLEMLRAT